MNRICMGGVGLVSLKNKELFRIEYMNGPRMRGVQLVDWCISLTDSQSPIKQGVVQDCTRDGPREGDV